MSDSQPFLARGAARHLARPLLVFAAVGLAGCAAVGLAPPEIDPQATFAAYREHGGLAIARAAGGDTGAVEAVGWSDLAPAYRVVVRGQTMAELRVPSPARVEVRAAGAGASGGGVEPSWDDGAIRLVIRPTSGPTLRTRTFRRVETTSGLSILTRNALSSLDLRGTYRSDLRDSGDQIVGWLQVRVWEPSGRHVYEAVLPGDFPVVDAAAAALALDSELAWIRRYVLDAVRGSTAGMER